MKNNMIYLKHIKSLHLMTKWNRYIVLMYNENEYSININLLCRVLRSIFFNNKLIKSSVYCLRMSLLLGLKRYVYIKSCPKCIRRFTVLQFRDDRTKARRTV